MTPEELETSARSLSGGYLVQTQGHRAAETYLAAARAYRDRGDFQDPYRALRCSERARWCDAQEASQ